MAKILKSDKYSISTDFSDFYENTAKVITQKDLVGSYEEDTKPSINYSFSSSKIEETNSRIKTKDSNKQDINDLFSIHNRTINFINMVRSETFEAGYSTGAEEIVKSMLEKNPLETRDWINTIFLDYFDDVKVLIGILNIISHLDYIDVYPEGQTMALAVTRHKSVEVRELAVRAFENWGTKDSLKILKRLNFSEKWLQEYVDEVINDLEEE